MTRPTVSPASNSEGRKRNLTVVPCCDAAAAVARASAFYEGLAADVARVSALGRVEALAATGLRGFDMNPTLPIDGRDTAWWLDYLRRHDDYWRSALRAALDGPAGGGGCA